VGEKKAQGPGHSTPPLLYDFSFATNAINQCFVSAVWSKWGRFKPRRSPHGNTFYSMPVHSIGMK